MINTIGQNSSTDLLAMIIVIIVVAMCIFYVFNMNK